MNRYVNGLFLASTSSSDCNNDCSQSVSIVNDNAKGLLSTYSTSINVTTNEEEHIPALSRILKRNCRNFDRNRKKPQNYYTKVGSISVSLKHCNDIISTSSPIIKSKYQQKSQMRHEKLSNCSKIHIHHHLKELEKLLSNNEKRLKLLSLSSIISNDIASLQEAAATITAATDGRVPIMIDNTDQDENVDSIVSCCYKLNNTAPRMPLRRNSMSLDTTAATITKDLSTLSPPRMPKRNNSFIFTSCRNMH